MIILAVDYGYIRTGLAICDRTETLSSPIGTIKESYMPKVAKRISEIASERNAEMIVIGLPKNMDGSEGEHAQKSRELAQILEYDYKLAVELCDERLTTVLAYRLLDESGTYGKKRKDAIDTVSATVILEDYLKNKQAGSQSV